MTEQRPWGSYTVLLDAPYTKVKQINVKPHARLSLQSHKGRHEYWTVVQGTPIVEVGEQSQQMVEQMMCFIPKETKHRLTNITDEEVIVIEVQVGESFDENDIIRYEDDYGRSSTPGNVDTSAINLK